MFLLLLEGHPGRVFWNLVGSLEDNLAVLGRILGLLLVGTQSFAHHLTDWRRRGSCGGVIVKNHFWLQACPWGVQCIQVLPLNPCSWLWEQLNRNLFLQGWTIKASGGRCITRDWRPDLSTSQSGIPSVCGGKLCVFIGMLKGTVLVKLETKHILLHEGSTTYVPGLLVTTLNRLLGVFLLLCLCPSGQTIAAERPASRKFHAIISIQNNNEKFQLFTSIRIKSAILCQRHPLGLRYCQRSKQIIYLMCFCHGHNTIINKLQRYNGAWKCMSAVSSLCYLLEFPDAVEVAFFLCQPVLLPTQPLQLFRVKLPLQFVVQSGHPVGPLLQVVQMSQLALQFLDLRLLLAVLYAQLPDSFFHLLDSLLIKAALTAECFHPRPQVAQFAHLLLYSATQVAEVRGQAQLLHAAAVLEDRFATHLQKFSPQLAVLLPKDGVLLHGYAQVLFQLLEGEGGLFGGRTSAVGGGVWEFELMVWNQLGGDLVGADGEREGDVLVGSAGGKGTFGAVRPLQEIGLRLVRVRLHQMQYTIILLADKRED